MGRATWMAALGSCVMAGCASPGPEVTRLDGVASLSGGYALAPPGADPALCYGRDVSPARIETVTRQVAPPPGGAAEGGAAQVYETRTERRITHERREQWFETPCPPAVTQEFVGTLQRALKARALYEGPITGRMDARTRQAVRAYQSERGLDSAVLSMRSAREMGLVTTRLDEDGAPDTDAPLLPPDGGG